MEYTFEKRNPGLILVYAIITCGIYMIYWYYKMYEELEILSEKTPTENPFIMDFLLNIITCGVWGIYVDYKISLQLMEMQKKYGMTVNDSSATVVLLDCVSYMTCAITNAISSSIHQDHLNQIMDRAAEASGN